MLPARDFIPPACGDRIEMRVDEEMLVKGLSQKWVTAEKSIPLTDGQRELWLLAQMSEQSSAAYNEPLVFKLRGEVRVQALQDALEALIARHEALRTCLDAEGKFQRVFSASSVRLQELDLSNLPGKDQEQALNGEVLRHVQRAFDLQKCPLLRAMLVRLNETEHVLALALHHIITDASSNGMIISDMAALYSEMDGATPATLSPVKQWSQLAQELTAPSAADAAEKFWQDEYADGFPSLDLPTDRIRPGTQTFPGKRQAHPLSPALSKEITHFAQSNGFTFYGVMLAAFQLLLHRITGQSEFATGILTSQQHWSAADGYAIGYAVKLLPLRSCLDERSSFLDHADQSYSKLMAVVQHQQYPLSKIAAMAKHQAGRRPLLASVFNVESAAGKFPFGPLEGEFISVHNGFSKFDANVTVNRGPDRLVVHWEYNTDLFDPQTIQRWLRHFEHLLQTVVDDPQRELWRNQFLTADEIHQILTTWNSAAPMDVEYRCCLHTLFEEQVKQRPDAIALITDEKKITYGELSLQSDALANVLRNEGVCRETVVGVLLERSIEMVVAVLGILKAGGAYLPLDVNAPVERLSFMLYDAKARLLVTDQPGRLQFPDFKGAILQSHSDWTAQQSPRARSLASDPAQLAYVIYTSGSTGSPKGVMVSHAAILNRLLWMKAAYGFDQTVSTLQKTPLVFDASIWELFIPLLSGGRCVLARPEGQLDPGYMARRVAEESISVLQLVPSVVSTFLQHGIAAQGHLKHLFCGGEAFPASLARFAMSRMNARVTNLYGPTEAAIDVTACDFDDSCDRLLVPIGRPISHTRAYILDRNLVPVPVAACGELYVSGPGLARGYCNRPALTAEKFLPDPCAVTAGGRMYRTGDHVRWLANGKIEFIGRSDTQIKLRGFRIELGEIEAALSRHPEIKEAIVTKWTEPEGEDHLVAYISPTGSSRPSAAELRMWLLRSLPAYMIPSKYMLVESIPRTASGKLDRRSLPEPSFLESANHPAMAPVRTPLQEMMADLWREILHREVNDAHANFFDIGGHSLLIFQLLARIEEVFGARISVRTIFDAPTIEELAKAIELARRSNELPARPPLRSGPRHEPIPLSFSQQRLWFLDRLEPESVAYNLIASIELRQELNFSIVERAIDEIVRRHEVLRTVFVEKDGVPAQVILPHMPIPVGRTDLKQTPADERWNQAREALAAETNFRFDLATGPLLRAHVLELGHCDHLILMTMHHVVSDAWSVAILRHEFLSLYTAFSLNEPSPLPNLKAQYADYAVWQRAWLVGPVLQDHIAYWTGKLEQAPPVVALMPDRPRPPVQSYEGNSLIVAVPGPEADALRKLARNSSATLFMVLLAAFKALMVRYGAGEDIVVGTHIANRDSLETERLIGCFVNSLVLRTDLSGSPAFQEILNRVRDSVLSAFLHQEMPFEQLVEILQPRRDLSLTPLYQVAFDFVLEDSGAAEKGASSMILADTKTAKFDLSVTVEAHSDRLAIVAEYCSDLYDRSTIEQFLAHYQRFLTSVATGPKQSIHDVELLDMAERRQLLEHSRGRRAQYPVGTALAGHIEEQAKRTPERIAAVADPDTITYGELNGEANRIARLAIDHLKPGEFVAILLSRGTTFLSAALAVLKIGCAYVPLDPDYPEARIDYMIQKCGAAALITDSQTMGSHRRAIAAARNLQFAICVDSNNTTAGASDDATTWFGRSAFASLSPLDLAETHVRGPRLPAYALFTSGSTGFPKAAIVRSDGAVNHIFAQMEELKLEPGFVFLQSAPSSSDISVWQMWAPLFAGGRTVIVDSLTVSNPALLLEVLQRERVSIVELVPAVLRCLLAHVADQPRAKTELRDLHWLMLTGEEIPADLINQWLARYPEIPVVNAYGPTEASDDVSQEMVSMPLPEGRPIASIGTPLPNIDCYILSSDLRLVPPCVPGELCVGGIAVGDGYLNDPKQTASSFVPDAFSGAPGARIYRTGDLCRRLPNGAFEFLGRLDHQVKMRGFRIELGEVEAALRSCAGVEDCAVLVVGEEEQKQLCAYVVLHRRAVWNPAEAQDALRSKLPSYMVPTGFVVQESLPRMPSGKLDHQALARIRPPAPEEARLPLKNAQEKAVAEIWAEVLHIDLSTFHADSDFFRVGGHSLLASLIVARIYERMNVQLSMRNIFEFSTIERLSAHIDLLQRQKPVFRTPALVRVARTGRRSHAAAVES